MIRVLSICWIAILLFNVAKCQSNGQESQESQESNQCTLQVHDHLLGTTKKIYQEEIRPELQRTTDQIRGDLKSDFDQFTSTCQCQDTKDRVDSLESTVALIRPELQSTTDQIREDLKSDVDQFASTCQCQDTKDRVDSLESSVALVRPELQRATDQIREDLKSDADQTKDKVDSLESSVAFIRPELQRTTDQCQDTKDRVDALESTVALLRELACERCSSIGTNQCDPSGRCVCLEGYTGSRCDEEVRNMFLVATATREDTIKATEIFDMTTGTLLHCPKIQPFPLDMSGASGGLIDGKPMICGGNIYKVWDYSKACHVLNDQGEWIEDQTASLNRYRYYSGTVVMDNELVMMGGWYQFRPGGEYLETIEVVSPNTRSRILSVKLPHGTDESCVVPWNATTFFVVGGRTDETSYETRTYFINMENGRVTQGPDLLTGRHAHGCEEMLVHGHPYIIVQGGLGPRRGERLTPLKSTEMLDKSNVVEGWTKGKEKSKSK